MELICGEGFPGGSRDLQEAGRQDLIVFHMTLGELFSTDY